MINRKHSPAFFIRLNHSNNKHLVINLLNNKQMLLTLAELYSFLDDKLYTKMTELNYTNFVCFVLNLGAFFDYLSSMITFKVFHYRNVTYSLTSYNALYVKKRIVFKDLGHFLQENTANDLNNISLFKEFAGKILTEFNIDLYESRILGLPGLSQALFKRISPEKNAIIRTLNKKEDTFLRTAFYGGRNEIYKPQLDGTFFYDINSLYPFIMSEHSLPTNKPKYTKKVIFDNNFFGFVDAVVIAPENCHLPLLPIKSEENHAEMGLLYPQGTFRGTFFSEELKMAENYGYIILETYEGYYFEKNVLFKSFIDKIYTLRINEPNKNIKKLYKKLMVALYGCYAVIYETIKDIQGLNVSNVRYKNVAISAAISALGRMYIYKYIYENQLDVFYWDTDGIIVKNPLTINVGNGLGQFRLVYKIDKGICLSQKFYCFKSSGEYYAVLRGISKDTYDINAQIILELFEKEIHNLANPGLEYTFTFYLPLKNKPLEEEKELTIAFHKKRKYYFQGSLIFSKPFCIKPASTS